MIQSSKTHSERLRFPDDEADAALASKLSEDVDKGLPIPEIRVFEEDGDFYIADGVESALAYSFSDAKFIPAILIKGCTDGKKYVKMKNSL